MQLSYRLHGDHDPTLTVLHGGLTGARTWDSLAASVTDWCRVMAPDLPGFGDSEPAERLDAAEVAAAIIDSWDAEGIESSYVAGFSAGGMLAQQLAHLAGPRVKGVVLMSTCAGLSAAAAGAYAERSRQIEETGLRPHLPELIERAFSPGFAERQPELIAAYGRQIESTGGETIARTLRFVSEFDGRALLPEIEAPALVISGALDDGMPPALGADLAAGLRSSAHIVLPGAGHTVHIEAAGTVAHILVDFIDSGATELDVFRHVA